MDYRPNCKWHVAVLALVLLLGWGLCTPGSSFGKPLERPSTVDKGEVRPGEFLIEEPERKDPFVAGLMSWAWPGLGQFYAQDYTMGSFFLLTNIVQKGLLVYMLFYYSDKYNVRDNEKVTWQDMEPKDKTLIIGYIFSILFIKVACVMDAVYSAENYNERVFFPYWKYKNRVRLSVEVESNRLNIALTKPL
ncbi:MAG TPA: hypothetical protein ENN21_01955 [Spirochaetes bacterium]|nr:hypothetical protein [Spirochaetota bacterium]